MPNNINLIIARYIALAQVASDAGKNIYNLKLKDCKHEAHKASKYKYNIKDGYIFKALTMINTSQSDWRYHVEKRGDQNGYPSKVIIFVIKIDNKYYQTSFHSFGGGLIKDLAFRGAGTNLSWDKKDSRMSIFKAYTALGGKAFLKF